MTSQVILSYRPKLADLLGVDVGPSLAPFVAGTIRALAGFEDKAVRLDEEIESRGLDLWCRDHEGRSGGNLALYQYRYLDPRLRSRELLLLTAQSGSPPIVGTHLFQSSKFS